MTIPREHTYKDVAKRSLWFVVRVVLALVIFVALYMIVGGALGFALPHTMILLTFMAMIWYLARTGQGKRFSLHGLLVSTAGLAIIAATAAWVPAWMLGGGAGRITKRVVIEVVDETTRKPVSNAEVVLTKRDEELVVAATYQGATNPQGVSEIACECTAESRTSILLTWRTYYLGGWLLEAKAPGYLPTEKVLSDITIVGEGGGPIHLRIELERNP